ERRRELRRGAVVVAAALALTARAAGAAVTAAFASGAAITIAAFTARAAVAAVAARATIPAVTAWAAVAARAAVAAFARLARRAGVGQLFAGLLVDQAHRQADLAALVDLEQLDLDLLAFGEDVADVLDPLVPDLADVDQPVLARH